MDLDVPVEADSVLPRWLFCTPYSVRKLDTAWTMQCHNTGGTGQFDSLLGLMGGLGGY